MSDVRQRLGGIAKNEKGAADRNIRPQNPPTRSESVKSESTVERLRSHPPATTRRSDDSRLGKESNRKDNDLDKGAPKHGELPHVDKKPVIRTPAGNVGPQRTGHNRGEGIDDVRKRLPPQKVAPPRAAQGTHHNAAKPRHQNRLKQVDLDRLTAGKTARSLRLADQYRLVHQGDAARRLGLYKPGHHPNLHRGPISPNYSRHCFKHRYWGPSLFVGLHLYPNWGPWVQWSWGCRCRPYWDPRPICCRPVIYGPCPAWVYWETPVWTPMPVAACGTWVELPPAPVPDFRSDLQLAAVRFVDPGHPEEKLGPRYRVWFRNNGNLPISQPFDVMLFAGNQQRLAVDLPQAGVRVSAIGAGEIQSVDVRLPIEALAMGRDAEGNPTPFTVLHVLVDAAEEIAETTKANNGASLTPADVLPVDPAAFELEPLAAKSGGEVILAGEGFGPQPGRVLLVVGGKESDAEILGWYDLGVRFSLPKLLLAAPAEAEVIVIRGDGAAANPLKIAVTPE